MTHIKQFESVVARGAGESVAVMATLLVSATALAQDAKPQEPRDANARDGATLEEIVVTADRRDSFGAEFVQAGTFRNQRAIDTPLTVAVVTKDLLNSQQAVTVFDAARNTAGVTASQINTVIYSNLAIRGIPVNNFTNYRLNGVLPIVNLIDMPLENKDRVEILKGASGLYYGFASPAGIVNLTSERPTPEPFTSVDLTGNSNGAYGGGFDVSRSWGNQGLRINAAAATIETGVDRTSGDRRFASAAYVWEPTEKLSFELDGEYIYRTVTEPTEYALPAPVNGVTTILPLQRASKNVGADWLQADGYEYNLMSKVRYDFSPAWSASFSVGQSSLSRTRRYSSFGGYDLATGNGTVNVAIFYRNDYENFIYRGDLAGAFTTGPIEHEILLGYSETTTRSFIPTAARTSYAQNLYNPVEIPEQPNPVRIIANPAEVRDAGYYIMDRAKITDWLQLTAGYRGTDYRNHSPASTYEATPESLSYGVLLKPREWISLYGTYIEGLEEGGTAPGIALNAGTILPAAVSEQHEFGVKIQPMRGLMITAAYFDIDRASSYLNPSNYFVRDGRASYKGYELSATGEITRDLSIAISAISLDAIQESGAAAVVGKKIENTAETTGSVFLEYRLPFVPGLRISGGAFYTGERAVNAANTAFIPGYTTYDLGASYSTDMNGRKVTFRVNGENITGKRYWAATGASLVQQGMPGSVRFSVNTEF
ncbi:TonB-dependent siderophore receptor [Peristeroidobacter soli]|uniref:TonB-dependent siderophore receptor n=1 Tax=Peristeroidobacter soli TaxID=2497877 RepID=UPI00101D9940|nr:TonB-dependent receptor [Peristeroidobacter soli]